MSYLVVLYHVDEDAEWEERIWHRKSSLYWWLKMSWR